MLVGSSLFDRLSIFNVFILFSNVPTYFFRKESEYDNFFFEKQIFKKLSNLTVFLFLFITEESQTSFFSMFYVQFEYFRFFFMIQS